MAGRSPPNEYMDLGLDQLSQVMMERAGQLLKDETVGRRDTAYVLIAAAHRVSPASYLLNSPHRLVREKHSTATEAFAQVMRDESRAARYLVLRQVVDALGIAMDPDLGPWLGRASESDQGAIDAIATLDARASTEASDADARD